MPMSPRLLRPRATGFNPKSISGLDLWFDANDASTITVSTGVATWANKSGLTGRNMTQATGNNQPAYTSGYLNGKPSVVFDGNNDSLSCTSATLTHPYHLFLVMRHTGSYVSTVRFSGSPSDGNVISALRQSASDISLLNGSPFGNTTGNPSVPPQTFSVLEFDINGASSVARCNGTAYSTINGTMGTSNPGGFVIGGSLNTFSGIAVSEIIIYARTLLPAERSKVTNAMRSKWGV
jgi:hypothetical protein